MRVRFVSGVVLLAVMSCATAPEIPVTAARTKLIGLTQTEVQACMGAPAQTQSRGGTTLYTYSSARAQLPPIVTPTDLTSVNFNYAPLSGDPPMPGLGEGEGPVPPAGCLVNVVFNSGNARTVTYVGPGGKLLAQAPECTEVVQRCVH